MSDVDVEEAAQRRRRTRRWLLMVRSVTGTSLLVTSSALVVLLPLIVAIPTALVLSVATFRRLRPFHDSTTPRWVTELVDTPLFVTWAAGLFAVPALVVIVPAYLFTGGLTPSVLISAVGTGWLIAAWGAWGRRLLVRTTHVDVPIPDLPDAFDGYTIAQLSDLHIGSYAPKSRGLRWVQRCNREQPNLVCVTGDLVSSGTQFYDTVAEVLAQLRGTDGTIVSMGNHDQWDNEKLVAAIRERGPTVLLNEWQLIERDGAALCIAGLDDKFAGRDDLDATLRDRPEGVPTVLLSHYPTFFEPAGAYGVELTLSGHTHGGQLGVPFVKSWNFATVTKQRPAGLFFEDGRHLYVHPGLGTTGPPIRIGIAPEVTILHLRRATATV